MLAHLPLEHYVTDTIWADPVRSSTSALERLEDAINTAEQGWRLAARNWVSLSERPR